jgi:GT2 family glycosyltransferase
VNHLRKCLQSIYSKTQGIEFDVIVVDNASYDGCDEMLATNFPAVKFIQSSHNLGFAGANNLGFAHSSGENLLFLNPDTEVRGSAINEMLSVLKSIPDAGAVGCKLLNQDLTLQMSCIQRFPTVLNQLFDTDYLIRRFPRLPMFGVKPLFFYAGTPEPVEVISGACIMTKRSVFEALNKFSTDYFMYAEDLDLCYKIREGGLKAYYVGGSTVVHFGGASAAKVNHFNAIVKRESITMFLQKFSGRTSALLYRASTLLISLVRLLIIAMVLAGGSSRRRDAAAGAFGKWTKIMRWSIGLEGWAACLHNATISGR